MDIYAHNRKAWDKWAEQGIEWSIPVTHEVIEAARHGEWQVLLVESKPVPRAWFRVETTGTANGSAEVEDCVKDLDILCLASGGGQQGPVLAAAGARVTVLDASPQQLERDRMVAKREGLDLKTVLGDMRDLGMFAGESFDLVFHPVSNVFVQDILPVWKEAYRVLRPGGLLLAGIVNPIEYTFDPKLIKSGIYQLKYSLPYSDLTSISLEERKSLYGEDVPIEFSHSLDEQIGGQLEAGFVIVGFYESYRANDPIAQYIPTYIATRAIKLKF